MTTSALNSPDISTNHSTTPTWVWSAEQTAIFDHIANPHSPNLVVRARAGTGKTTVIIEAMSRVKWASSVILCAFNKSIAVELQRRIYSVSTAEAKTLHSIGFMFVRNHWSKLELDGAREFKLARELDIDNIDVSPSAKLAVKVKEICGELPDHHTVEELAWKFDCLPDENSNSTVADIIRYALDICAKSKIYNGSISYADMVWLPVVMGWTRPLWELAIVDETQDMSPVQIKLFKGIFSKRAVVVGDDHQAIYGFRGADQHTIDNLKTELNADERGLTVTYRCPKAVVELAREIVPDYVAADTNSEGSISTIDIDELHTNVREGDFILSRKNAPLMSVCLQLLKAGIPAKIKGKDIGKQLLGLVDKSKATTVSELVTWVTEWQARELKRAHARGNDVGSDRASAVCETANTLIVLCEDEPSMEVVRFKLQTLFSDTKDTNNVVMCSSVHKAKGLESNHVFILQDTLYPGGRQTLEEHNIEYVAITRSIETLTWVLGAE